MGLLSCGVPVDLEGIFVSLIIIPMHFSKCLLSTWGPKKPKKWLSTRCPLRHLGTFKKFPGVLLCSSGLKIWHCLCSGLDCCCGVGSHPWLHNFHMLVGVTNKSINKNMQVPGLQQGSLVYLFWCEVWTLLSLKNFTGHAHAPRTTLSPPS